MEPPRNPQKFNRRRNHSQKFVNGKAQNRPNFHFNRRINRFLTPPFTDCGIVICHRLCETQSVNTLPELVKGHLYVLTLPRSLRRPTLNELTARLALRGEVQVLVAGNRFDAHGIARLLRRQTTAVFPALQRIRLARAFTCYQVASLLSEVAAAQLPTLVTDLLDTFYDENVSLPERQALLTQCLQALRRLSQQAEVLISVVPPESVLVCGERTSTHAAELVSIGNGRISACPTVAVERCPGPLGGTVKTPPDLFEMLLGAADVLWTIEVPTPQPVQLNLL